MQEVPQDAWYYTRDGERLGPVSLTELRELARVGTLDPRLGLVWTQGMAEWQAAGEVDGLFEKRLPPPQIDLAPSAGTYVPPKLESREAVMSRIDDWPGARRRSFLVATILFPFLWNMAVTLTTGVLTTQFGPRIMGMVGTGAAFVPLLVGIHYGLLRLVNLGMSRWWYLANFVPLLNLWVGYRCFACPAGYACHRKLDGAGVFLAIVYWLLVTFVILALVALVAMCCGAIGNPALQEHLREALRIISQRWIKP
jgi:hypothetical protein